MKDLTPRFMKKHHFLPNRHPNNSSSYNQSFPRVN